MAVYSRRFFDANVSGDPSDHPMPAVPANTVWVVKFVTAFTTVANNNAHLALPSGVIVRFFHDTDGYQSWADETRIVLRAGEILNFHIYVGNWHFSAHGYQFAA